MFDRTGDAVGNGDKELLEKLIFLPIDTEVQNRHFLPEGDGGDPSHERIRSDALQVEQGAVKNKQQDHVLVQA